LKISTTYRPGITDPLGWNRQYTTGFLSSLRTDGTGFHTTGGHEQYFECRFIAPPNPGCWPAFWTLTANNYQGRTSEPCDELDVIEGYVGWPLSYHIATHQWNYSTKTTYDTLVNYTQGDGGGIVQNFHTYGVKITQSITTYYLDNVAVFSEPTLEQSWSQGNYFMVNNAFKDNDALLFGTFQRYGNSADMYIDYVRVYQK
jgi:beta-glucanase (GH16 family)